MPNLKTTPKERQAVVDWLRGGNALTATSDIAIVCRALDDLDTLAAEVASHETMRKTALALIASYERGDEPEGAPSASRTLLAIAELLRSDP